MDSRKSLFKPFKKLKGMPWGHRRKRSSSRSSLDVHLDVEDWEERVFPVELDALEVRDRQSLVLPYLNSFSVRYLRGIRSPLSIPAHV